MVRFPLSWKIIEVHKGEGNVASNKTTPKSLDTCDMVIVSKIKNK